MIADQLNISYETVRSHVKKIYEKTACSLYFGSGIQGHSSADRLIQKFFLRSKTRQPPAFYTRFIIVYQNQHYETDIYMHDPAFFIATHSTGQYRKETSSDLLVLTKPLTPIQQNWWARAKWHLK
jgi:hypothetical protein